MSNKIWALYFMNLSINMSKGLKIKGEPMAGKVQYMGSLSVQH